MQPIAIHDTQPAVHDMQPPGVHDTQPPALGRLTGPLPALPRLRRLFDPRRGWFRRIEREVNTFLSARVHPWIPGISRPYELLLERYLTVSEATIELRRLHRGLDGLRILLITDIHVGPFLSVRALSRTFDRLLTLDPDLILLGGDLTTSRISEFVAQVDAFRSLRAPLGTYAVLGNHDHYCGDPVRLCALLASCGIRVLNNEWVPVERGGGSLAVAGIDDLVQGKPDLEAAIAGAAPPIVLLSHNPDIFFEAARRGVSVVLSGHTHAGQIRIPRLPVLVRQSRYHLDEGRYAAEGSELVVSRGLGVSGLPLRIACSPEAVLLQLRAR